MLFLKSLVTEFKWVYNSLEGQIHIEQWSTLSLEVCFQVDHTVLKGQLTAQVNIRGFPQAE